MPSNGGAKAAARFHEDVTIERDRRALSRNFYADVLIGRPRPACPAAPPTNCLGVLMTMVATFVEHVTFPLNRYEHRPSRGKSWRQANGNRQDKGNPGFLCLPLCSSASFALSWFFGVKQ